MSAFEAFDLMARGGAVTLLALWSWLLIRDHRAALAARVAVAMNAAIVCHILVTSSLPSPGFGPDIVLQLGAAAVPGLFWLYARAWFEDETRIGWQSWALVALSLANLLVLLATFERKTAIQGGYQTG